MKKYSLLAAMILAFSLVFTGCGDSGTPSSTNPGNETSDVAGTDPFLLETLEEMQDGLAEIREQLGDSMEMEVTTRGNSLVYTYTILEAAEEGEDVSANLEAGVDMMRSVFETLVQEFKDNGVDDASVVLEYLDAEGTMLYTREFK